MRNCEKWTIAYRKRLGGCTLMDNLTEPFVAIPNNWRYWRADPFLVEHRGKTYLFAEMYDRLRLRGVIGCCELTQKGCSPWRVIIEELFHLSYPFVFRHDNETYLIPESFRSGKITLYKAVDFPYAWKRVCEIAEMVSVDSTIIQSPKGSYMITLRIVNAVAELVIMSIDDQLCPSEPHVISGKEDPNVRPAGRTFCYEGKMIRPAQDCTKGYGFGLNFYEVVCLDADHYEEKLLKKILPSDISVRNEKCIHGIHTYNLTDDYEVIDYKKYELGIVSKVAKVVSIFRSKI